LSKALATARRQKHKVALLFFDLDRFKIINDSLGHSVGDLLLQDVAERLKSCAREEDTVARLGGDEFLIVLTHVNDVPGAAVSAERFMDAMTTRFVIQGHSLSHLELELTESLLLGNADVTLSVLQELKAMGLTLAIDDFGTGYSSFSYLKRFPVSKLKIDRSFVRDVAVNPDDAAITTAIISMAKSLNLKVIAEGVEDEAQMSFLRAHQCDEIQGYYFSRPLAVDKVAEKLRGEALQALVENHGA